MLSVTLFYVQTDVAGIIILLSLFGFQPAFTKGSYQLGSIFLFVTSEHAHLYTNLK